MGYLVSLLAIALYLLIVTFMIRLVFDWVTMFARYWRPKGLTLILASFVYSVTDPLMNLTRRFIKPLNLGGISLDLGFMVLLVVLGFGFMMLSGLTQTLS